MPAIIEMGEPISPSAPPEEASGQAQSPETAIPAIPEELVPLTTTKPRDPIIEKPVIEEPAPLRPPLPPPGDYGRKAATQAIIEAAPDVAASCDPSCCCFLHKCTASPNSVTYERTLCCAPDGVKDNDSRTVTCCLPTTFFSSYREKNSVGFWGSHQSTNEANCCGEEGCVNYSCATERELCGYGSSAEGGCKNCSECNCDCGVIQALTGVGETIITGLANACETIFCFFKASDSDEAACNGCNDEACEECCGCIVGTTCGLIAGGSD
jgi:hypothetical protein